MTEIEKNRPDLFSCRRAEYVSIVNVLNNYSFIYKGNKTLTEDETIPEIKMKTRPGGKCFAAPGACFIMQFNRMDKTTYYGSIIHRDLSREEICHPTIIEASIMMNNASKNYTTQIINYKDKTPIPYNVNKTTINYLIDHINELNDIDGHLSITITGDKFSYSVEEEEFVGNPISWASAPCVFGMKSDFYSHLVVLSNKEIPNATSLNWADRKISLTYSDVDALVHVSNQIYRGVVEVTHEFDLIYFMNRNAQVNVDGRRPMFHDTTQESDVYRPIGCMLDSFAMHCIEGSKLVRKVDLKGFSLSGNINCNGLKKDIIGLNVFRKNYPNKDPFMLIDESSRSVPNISKLQHLYDQRTSAFIQLNAAKDEMKRLSSLYNSARDKRPIISQQS